MTGIDLEGFGDLTEAQRTALELGDPDAMMELFAADLKEGEQQEDDANDPEITDVEPVVKPAESAPSGAEGENAENAYVETKDGKHRIPYSELQTARDQAKQFKSLYEQAAQQNELTKKQQGELQQMLDQMNRKVDLLKGQVTDAGREPAKLPEEIRFTDDMLANLKEYGEAGEAIIALANELRSMKPATTPTQQDPDNSTEQAAGTQHADVATEVATAIAANSDLSEWQKSDPVKWAAAVKLDQQLRTDPDFQDQSFEERFAAVARMTRAKFGMPVLEASAASTAQQQAQEKIRRATEQAAAPKSLSALGRADSSSESDMRERIANLTEEQAAEMGHTMSLDDLEKLLD